MLCDENGIGGDGEYCGDNAAQLGRINVLYHEASGDKYVPHTAPFDLEPGVIDAVRAPRSRKNRKHSPVRCQATHRPVKSAFPTALIVANIFSKGVLKPPC
jgi:hypothetical protein